MSSFNLTFLLGVFFACGLGNAFLFCSDHAESAESLMATYQGVQDLRKLKDMSLLMYAWQPQGSESSNTCYKLSLDIAAGTYTLNFKDSAGTAQAASGTIELVQRESSYLLLNQTSGPTNMNLLGYDSNNANGVKIYVSYLNDNLVAMKSCIQGFFSAEGDYLFSTKNITNVPENCFEQKLRDVLRMRGQKLNVGNC